MASVDEEATAANTEGEHLVWRVGDRHYTVTAWPLHPGDPPSRFIKRQLRPHERIIRYDGEPALGYFNIERLENERNALNFIAQNTTIPVPRVLDWSVDEDGTASLTMETVGGRIMTDLLRDDDLTEEEKATLKRNVESFMQDVVLPQLGKLRSKSMGQLGGVLFMPPRIERVHNASHPNGARAWPAKQAATERYIYCHNDLATQNVVIHPDSLDVKCLIDWEYSGFFPPGFEFPYWRYTRDDYIMWDNDENGTMMASRRALLQETGKVSATSFRVIDAK
ncbi:MAG: hypothetical protein Q9166_005250 [cf. Caloplaca sp. 2 TL-2023]